MATLSEVERIKAASDGLRGSLALSLDDAPTAGLREDDQQLIKLHGIYQQDDRDQREARRQRKLEPAYSFMIRVRLPAGICSTGQWLTMDALASEHGDGSLKLTTRQTFELQGVIKESLRPTLQAMDRALLDAIAACGDVNRNVIAGAAPDRPALQARLQADAVALSEHFLPATRAYHEIFLGAERVAGGEPEPIYGPTYLPRKFKTVIAVPPRNDVDLYAHDLGFVAICEGDELLGYNLCVGGGMGTSHGEPSTYPRVATVLGFLPATQLLPVAEAVVTLQRDHGDRSNRKQARLKYTLDRLGTDHFLALLNERLGEALQPARPYAFSERGDAFGWQAAGDGRWWLTLRIEGGRLRDAGEQRARSALREIASRFDLRLRITPNQNLSLIDVRDTDRAAIDAVLEGHGCAPQALSPLRRDALACVALPLCPLAMAEAERWLPQFAPRVEALLAQHGLADESVGLRITGCPNGCARPYLAEIGLIGKAPGRYNLLLGGDRVGERLNALYRESLDEPAILAELDQLFGRWAAERHSGEGFGDFTRRTGLVDGSSPHPAPRREPA
ncbi:MAG: NADPH-dependent assimilatory sulfite reductase hemoprotein subunit [Lysobacterales bacterium]